MTDSVKNASKTSAKSKAATKTLDPALKKAASGKRTSKVKVESFKKSIENHLMYTVFKTPPKATTRDWYASTAHTVRDELIKRWIETVDKYKSKGSKRVYYLSLEFLIGRMLSNAALNMDINDELKNGLQMLGHSMEEVAEMENDAALGNGGLGRLAACFLDSMASMDIPGTGYGIRYEYGMFRQSIINGQQVENPDNWLRYGNIWEFQRPEMTYDINFYGKVVEYQTEHGPKQRWVEQEPVVAMAYDVPVPGFGTKTVNNLRLWSAKAKKDFDLGQFNDGQYHSAVSERHASESISQVLYPNDASENGKELRLKQQYFFVSASIQDILDGYNKHYDNWDQLPEQIAIQLNDTHPAIGVAEMMYQLVDIHGLDWDKAWSLVGGVFAYTNHTLMPEALETWNVSLFEKLLPRHLEIIYKINHDFLERVNHQFPGDTDLLSRVSIIDESNGRRVRMAHLAVVGSHTVNGVAALHSELLKETLFADFNRIYPGKLVNVTNGITPRRWLNQCNHGLTTLITQVIGNDFQKDLTALKNLEPLADDKAFREAFASVKQENKARLAAKIEEKTGIKVNVNSIFDVQIKRIHEYKRQLLNVLHIVTLYNRIKAGKAEHLPARTIIFGGKAAPGYWMAKQIIHLINDIADIVNNDPVIGDKLKVVYYPNYEVSAAELLFPGSDLSEQISTAGTEASGTGNMKMALNGALTIGTLDGANVEIREEVGEDNIFIFGLTTPEVAEVKANGYNPYDYYNNNAELKQVLDMIEEGFFNVEEPDRYKPVVENLLQNGDNYLLLADYQSYIETQDAVGELYLDQDAWMKKAILNVARMAKFSSDRTIGEYVNNIWNVKPVK